MEDGIRDYEPCSVCHRSGSEDEAKSLWRNLRRSGLSPTEAAKAAGSSVEEATRVKPPLATDPRRHGGRDDDDEGDDEGDDD